MKKTLLICTHYPLPENIGTSIRTMNFVRFFKKYGSVDIGYSQVLDQNQIGNPIFSNEFRLETKNFSNIKTRLINRLITGCPIPIYQFSENTRKRLLVNINSSDYDYILIRTLYNTSIFFKLPAKYRIRTIIDYDDLLSGSLYKPISAHRPLRKIMANLLNKLNKRLLSNHERKCLGSVAALFCSENDRTKMLGKQQNNGAFVVPNIYADNSFQDNHNGDGFDKDHTLLFVGTLSYEPNVDGLQWFVERVFPDFKRIYPGARFLVVGRFPCERVKNLCKHSNGVELFGDVPDVHRYYKQCRAAVVPILAGGGTRIKILEAALVNTPVLTTPLGVEGLELIDETDILVFRNSHEFCEKYVSLLDRDKYNALIHNAKKVVKNYYSINRFNGVLKQVLERIDQKRAA
jgi:glycosyltransferase involved in cell wall biosynthesis